VKKRVLLGGAVLLLAGAVHAEPPGPGVLPIQVIAIQSDGADDQADALTAAVRSRLRALRGYSLAESDYALEVLTLGLKCGEIPDETCQEKIGDHIHADRYIWGTVKRSKVRRQVTADLHLWMRGRPTNRTELAFSDNLTAPGDQALKRLADDALSTLLLEQPRTFPDAPAVTRSESLAPASAAQPLEGRSENLTASSAEVSEETGGNSHRTAGWAAVGLGSVLLGAGIYSVVRVQAIDTDERVVRYRQGFHAGTDVCDRAEAGIDSKVSGSASPTEMRDFCSSATTFETLQFIFFGLGAVSAGAGIYLLATNKSGATATTSLLTVAPAVGRSGGRLQLALSF
jgi:hypothetical protein